MASNCTLNIAKSYCDIHLSALDQHGYPLMFIDDNNSDDTSNNNQSASLSHSLFQRTKPCLIPELATWNLLAEVIRRRWSDNREIRMIFNIGIPIGLATLAGNVASVAVFCRRIRGFPAYGRQISLSLIDIITILSTAAYAGDSAFIYLWEHRALCEFRVLPHISARLEAIMMGSILTSNLLLSVLTVDHWYHCSQNQKKRNTGGPQIVGPQNQNQKSSSANQLHHADKQGRFRCPRILLINIFSYIIGYGITMSTMSHSVVWYHLDKQVPDRYAQFCFWLTHRSGGVLDEPRYLEFLAHPELFDKVLAQKTLYWIYSIVTKRGSRVCGHSQDLYVFTFVGCLLLSYGAVFGSGMLLRCGEYRQKRLERRKAEKRRTTTKTSLPPSGGTTKTKKEVNPNASNPSILYTIHEPRPLVGHSQKNSTKIDLKKPAKTDHSVEHDLLMHKITFALKIESLLTLSQMLIVLLSITWRLIPGLNGSQVTSIVLDVFSGLFFIAQCSVNFVVFLLPTGEELEEFVERLKERCHRFYPYQYQDGCH